MKKSVFTLICTIFTFFVACTSHKEPANTIVKGDSISSTLSDEEALTHIVNSIRKQSILYTTECQVHKVVLFSDEAHLGGKLLDISLPGERKVAIPIDVTLKGSVDFSSFSPKDIIIRDSVYIVNLPDPHITITASKINHKDTRQYIDITRSRFSDAEISRLAAQGKDTIANHLSNYGLIERSRESCARTIVPLIKHMGYAEGNIVVRFHKNYNDNELRSLSTSQK